MSSSPPTEAPAAIAFVCDCGEEMRSACKELSFYKAHEGKRYCVLHSPGKEKVAAFDEALKRKLDANDFNFHGVWFPDRVKFDKFNFTKSVNFYSTTFSAEANFHLATFRARAGFGYATFGASSCARGRRRLSPRNSEPG